MKLPLALLLLIISMNQLIAQTEKQPSMHDWEYPYEVRHISLNDSLDIAYVDEGKGKCTLLFIHGLGSNLKAWTKNIEVLKNDYRCIALDLPGYGKSGKGDFPYDMPFFAESVRGLISQLNLKNVVLTGHSMGAQVAMHTVLKNDDKIKKLVLIAPAGFETFTEQEAGWLKKVYNADFIKATPEAQILKNFEINFHDMPDDARFMIEDRLSMRRTAEYDRYCSMIPQCVAGMLDEPVYTRLPEIKLPVLVLYGNNDSLIPNPVLHAEMTTEAVARSGHERLPDSRLVMIPKAGHFVQWEQAEQVNKAILDFLK